MCITTILIRGGGDTVKSALEDLSMTRARAISFDHESLSRTRDVFCLKLTNKTEVLHPSHADRFVIPHRASAGQPSMNPSHSVGVSQTHSGHDPLCSEGSGSPRLKPDVGPPESGGRDTPPSAAQAKCLWCLRS